MANQGDGPVDLDAEARKAATAAATAAAAAATAAVATRKAAAEADTAVANARKAAADADKAEAEARTAQQPAVTLPSSDTKPLEGKVEVGEGAGLVAAVLAGRALEDVADRIAAEIEDKAPGAARAILIVEDRQLATSDWPREQIAAELGRLKPLLEGARTEIEAAIPAEPEVAPEPDLEAETGGGPEVATLGLAAALPVAGAVLSGLPKAVAAAADLVGMFRSDYAIKSKEVAVGGTPLVAAVASRLLSPDRAVEIDGFRLIADEGLIAAFEEVVELRLDLDRKRTELKGKLVDPADRRIELLRADHTRAAALYDAQLAAGKPAEELAEMYARVAKLARDADQEETQVASSRAALAIADALLTRFDAFATAVTKAPDSGGNPPLLAAALRERLHDGSKHSHVLYLGVDLSGGETITRRGLFGRTGQIGFLGGVQVTYLLLDVEHNRLVAAGTVPALRNVKLNLRDMSVEAAGKVTLP